MRWSPPRIVAIAAIAAAVALFCAQWLGLTEGWVTTGSAVLTVVVSIISILIPAQQETEKKRRAHLQILVDEVLTPLSGDLQQQYLASVSRTTFPLDWWPNIGLFVRSRGPLARALQSPPELLRGLPKHRYEDAAKNHYPAAMWRVEEFRRDFEIYLDSLLLQAQELEKELRSISSVRPIVGAEERLGCHYGSLALYVFNRLWTRGYDFPLAVRRDTNSQGTIWLLQKTSETVDLARGPEEEMRRLNELVETFVASKDLAMFTRSAEQIGHRLDRLQDEIAEIQASEELAGKCPAIG